MLNLWKRRVKVLTAYCADDLEGAVNEFLEELENGPDHGIDAIEYALAPIHAGVQYSALIRYTIKPVEK